MFSSLRIDGIAKRFHSGIRRISTTIKSMGMDFHAMKYKKPEPAGYESTDAMPFPHVLNRYYVPLDPDSNCDGPVVCIERIPWEDPNAMAYTKGKARPTFGTQQARPEEEEVPHSVCWMYIDHHYIFGRQHYLLSQGGLADRRRFVEDDSTKLHGHGQKVQKQIMHAIETFSLSAGALNYRNDAGALGHVSGFWLEPDKFVTCAHFINSWQTETRKREILRIMENTESSENSIIAVCSHLFRCRYDNRDLDIKVKLLKIDLDADIAVFRAFDDQKYKFKGRHEHEGRGIAFVKPQDLSVLDPDSSNVQLFSCCYVAEDMYESSGEETIYTTSVRKSMPIFENEDGIKNFEQSVPPFQQVFCPNMRAVACGELHVPPKDSEARSSLIRDFTSGDRLAIRRGHSISSFRGGSGGMIAKLEVDAAGNVHVKIVGVHFGQIGRNTNGFAALTDAGLEWIKNADEKSPKRERVRVFLQHWVQKIFRSASE